MSSTYSILKCICDPNLIAVIILLALLAFSTQANAQSLELNSTAQQTVMGLQTGHSVAYRMNNGLGIGTFYQSTNYLSLEQSISNYPFYGVDVSATIKNCGSVQVLAHLRTGIVNEKFLIATPELETRISLTRFIKLGIGAGYRSRKAAVSATIILTTL